MITFSQKLFFSLLVTSCLNVYSSDFSSCVSDSYGRLKITDKEKFSALLLNGKPLIVPMIEGRNACFTLDDFLISYTGLGIIIHLLGDKPELSGVLELYLKQLQAEQKNISHETSTRIGNYGTINTSTTADIRITPAATAILAKYKNVFDKSN